MATVSAQQVSTAGITPTYNSASGGGDKFPAGDDIEVEIVNGSGGSLTATFTTPGNVGGNAIADLAITVADGARKKVGPFPRSIYGDADGLVSVAWSATSSVTFSVTKV